MKRIAAALTALTLLAACDAATPAVTTPEAPAAPGPVAAETGPCSGIRAFETTLRHSGIMYDYEPSDSLQELASWADAVVVGTLLEAGDAPKDVVGRGMGTVAFTIGVDRVLSHKAGPEIGETVTVVTDFNEIERSVADYKKVFPQGAMTVVFLSEWREAWAFHLEGFWFACDEDEKPGNGLVEAGWSVESLGSMIESLKSEPEVKPEPSPTTAEFDSETLSDGRIRIRPRSAEVADEGTYRFTVPHCGLDWMVDFDASFWKAEHPADYGNGNRYPFFINSDVGTFTFVSSDRAIYEASTGEEIDLRRLDGRISVYPCM